MAPVAFVLSTHTAPTGLHCAAAPLLCPPHPRRPSNPPACLPAYQQPIHARARPPDGQPSPSSSEPATEVDPLVSDKPRTLRDFGLIALAASAIGLVLLCFDILVALLALTVAAFYALAVLFDVRPVQAFVARALSATVKALAVLPSALRIAWRALRREVRKGLED